MKIKSTLAAVAALAIAASVLTSTSAFAVGTLDHSSVGASTDFSESDFNTAIGQTFTAGLSGSLDRVTLDLGKYDSPGEFFVELYTFDAVSPVLLGSQAMPESSITAASIDGVSVTFSPVTVDFSSPASVVAGDAYVVVVRAANATYHYDSHDQSVRNSIIWRRASTDFMGYAIHNSPECWSAPCSFPEIGWVGDGTNLSFETYVTTTSAEISSGVTAGVTAGVRSAGLGLAAFDAVAFSHGEQTQTTNTTLSVDDLTGANAGWNVTVSSSVLTWSAAIQGPLAGSDLPASALAITTVGSITTVAGDDWTGSTALGSLDSPVTALSTSGGNGSYTVPLTLTLTVPGQASVGTYAGTLTTTISAAP